MLAAVRAAQAQLKADWPDLQARLWQRNDADVPATVMETYAAPGGITPAAQVRIDTVVGACVPCPRHVEAFVPASSGITDG